MFEDSLMESQGRLSSPTERWTTLASLTLQCSLAAALIILPLLHPEALPFHPSAPTINLPLKPIPSRVPHLDAATHANSAPGSSSTTATGRPRPLPELQDLRSIAESNNDAPPSIGSTGSMGDQGVLLSSIGNNSSTAANRVGLAQLSTARTGPLHISRGVSQGLLLEPIRPVYPRIAVSTRTEGVVIVQAIISKTGVIESIRATSGPQLLRSAAIDAVRNARYSPYLLNGLPTEVETTITVNFKLSA